MSLTHWYDTYREGIPLTMLTAYDATMAGMIEASQVDAILVGDSLRHTFFGDTTTVGATLDDMVYHTRAVCNGVTRTMVITDMPFMTYGICQTDTLRHAGALIQAGATGVKCEVRSVHVPMIHRLIQEGIPVMAHIGLQPQFLRPLDSYSVKGVTPHEQDEMIQLACRLENAGVCGIVLEKVPMALAAAITKAVNVPTIGIGAGPSCSGQVLVTNDVLGLTPNFSPKFLKKYCDGRDQMVRALVQFNEDVRQSRFPSSDHGYDE